MRDISTDLVAMDEAIQGNKGAGMAYSIGRTAKMAVVHLADCDLLLLALPVKCVQHEQDQK